MNKLIVALLSLSLSCFAQTANQSSAKTSNAGKSGANADAMFAKKAAQGNMAEVSMGKLALQQSQNDDVKKFGQRMVDDHSKAEQELEGVASKNNMTLPQDVDAQQKAEQQRLAKLSGPAFDRAYMRLMVQDHKKDVAEFQKEANNPSANADLKDFAGRTYPTLNDHLTMAKSINDAMASSGSKGSKHSKAGKNKQSASDSSAPASQGLLLI
jgi:putative membrane protein